MRQVTAEDVAQVRLHPVRRKRNAIACTICIETVSSRWHVMECTDSCMAPCEDSVITLESLWGPLWCAVSCLLGLFLDKIQGLHSFGTTLNPAPHPKLCSLKPTPIISRSQVVSSWTGIAVEQVLCFLEVVVLYCCCSPCFR